MKFLHPEFLYALFALAIPIIIHLFNFRRYKRVLFTNVAFLREVNERTQASQKIKHWLVLLSRMLLITFLVLAFAQPIVPETETTVKSEKAVSVFVDNSFSMQSENEEGPLFLQSLEVARTVARSYPPTADFQLLTHGFEGKHQRFTTQEDILNQIEELEVEPRAQTLSEIVSRQSDLLLSAPEKDRHLYIVSDFQRYMCDFESLEIDSSITAHFIPLPTAASENVYIDSIWFATPFHNINQQEQLNFRVRNHADQSAEDLPMSAWFNGAQNAVGTYAVSPYSKTDTALYFNNDSPGIRSGYVDIDDHPITYDDRYYFSYSVDSTLSVLEITGEEEMTGNRFFDHIFSDDPFYEFERVSARMIDYAALNTKHFIVLNQVNAVSSGLRDALFNFVENGGSVLLIPGLSIEAANLNDFTQKFRGPTFTEVVNAETRVNDIDREAPFFANLFERVPQNMDLPKVLSYYRLQQSTTDRVQPLMTLRNGDSFLTRTPGTNGQLYVSAVPLSTENNNFARHAIFVASVLRMSELSRPALQPSYSLAQDLAIPTGAHHPAGDDVFKVKSVERDFEVIPEFSNINGKGFLFLRNQIQEAGNYLLMLGDQEVMGISLNYPRSESVLEYFSPEELEAEVNAQGLTNIQIINQTGDKLEAHLTELGTGKKLWKIFILLALLFVLVEILLLKFWKQ